MKRFSKFSVGFFSALVGMAVTFGAFHFSLWAKDIVSKDVPPKINISSTPVNRDVKFGASFSPIVKKAAPSVVNIYSSRTVRVQPMYNPFQNDPLFRQFFGNQFSHQPRTRHEQSLGSGVIISADGYILTANHVVAGADEVKVALGDNENNKFTAKIIGTDPQTDVAVLKIDAKDLTAITLGDSDQLEVGDIVLAVGNPFGVGQTVTMGIISGLGRHGYGINGYEDFIQTDAAINPGNSGGALVDAEGRLIGINTWIASSSGGSEGVGFAVPIDMARHVMDRLISGGKVTRAMLGVLRPQDITPQIVRGLNLPDQSGALVGDIIPNSPAQKAGIQSGDVIVEFNGKKVADAHDLILQVANSSPGDKATVKVMRNGEQKTFNVTLAENKVASDMGKENASESENSNMDGLDGVTVQDLDSQAKADLKIPAGMKGALVSDVDSDSNAAEAGLQKNDVIIEINRHPVADAAEAVKLCSQAKTGQIILKVWRREGDMAGTLWIGVDNTKRNKGKAQNQDQGQDQNQDNQ